MASLSLPGTTFFSSFSWGLRPNVIFSISREVVRKRSQELKICCGRCEVPLEPDRINPEAPRCLTCGAPDDFKLVLKKQHRKADTESHERYHVLRDPLNGRHRTLQLWRQNERKGPLDMVVATRATPQGLRALFSLVEND